VDASRGGPVQEPAGLLIVVPEGLVMTKIAALALNHCSQGEKPMPVVFIEAPPGIRSEAKKQLVEKITAAIDEAYHIGDTLIFLREYPPENVALDGRLQSDNPKLQEILTKISS
jgi:phenylpyruvate tautomerase PptA (4-oxalocrotonate tautomerase family)